MAAVEGRQRPLQAETQLPQSHLRRLLNIPPALGDIWYLINATWFKQWMAIVGLDVQDPGAVVTNSGGRLGPIDNSALLKDGVSELKDYLMHGLNYVLVPKAAWEMLCLKYGTVGKQKPIARRVVQHGRFVTQLKVEVYLLELNLGRKDTTGRELVTKYFSRGDTIDRLEGEMRIIFGIRDDTEVRLWTKNMSNAFEPLDERGMTVLEAGMYDRQVILIEDLTGDELKGTMSRVSLDDCSEEVKQELQCIICLEILEDPKFVGPCHHTFCSQCIDKVIQSNIDKGSFPCPSCRRVYGIPVGGAADLQSDFRATGLIQALQTTPKQLARKAASACRICKATDASAYCEQCGAGIYLCSGCSNRHARTPATSNHKIISLLELCEPHEEPLKLYCKSCSKRLCHVCLLCDHDDHDVEERKVVVATMAKQLEMTYTESMELKESLASDKTAVQGLKAQVEDAARREKETSERRKHQMQAELAAIERQIRDLEERRMQLEMEQETREYSRCEWDWAAQQLESLTDDIQSATDDSDAAERQVADLKNEDLTTMRGEDKLFAVVHNLQTHLSLAYRVRQAAEDIQQNLSEVLNNGDDPFRPGGPETRKGYDRDFLLSVQHTPASCAKPEGLPSLPDVALDHCSSDRSPQNRRNPRAQPDFTQGFIGSTPWRTLSEERMQTRLSAVSEATHDEDPQEEADVESGRPHVKDDQSNIPPKQKRVIRNDRDFLLELQFTAASQKRPGGLPNINVRPIVRNPQVLPVRSRAVREDQMQPSPSIQTSFAMQVAQTLNEDKQLREGSTQNMRPAEPGRTRAQRNDDINEPRVKDGVICYDRDQLLRLQFSPASRVTPKGLPTIPGFVPGTHPKHQIQPGSTPCYKPSFFKKPNATGSADAESRPTFPAHPHDASPPRNAPPFSYGRGRPTHHVPRHQTPSPPNQTGAQPLMGLIPTYRQQEPGQLQFAPYPRQESPQMMYQRNDEPRGIHGFY